MLWASAAALVRHQKRHVLLLSCISSVAAQECGCGGLWCPLHSACARQPLRAVAAGSNKRALCYVMFWLLHRMLWLLHRVLWGVGCHNSAATCLSSCSLHGVICMWGIYVIPLAWCYWERHYPDRGIAGTLWCQQNVFAGVQKGRPSTSVGVCGWGGSRV